MSSSAESAINCLQGGFTTTEVADLPASLVHEMLQQARKSGLPELRVGLCVIRGWVIRHRNNSLGTIAPNLQMLKGTSCKLQSPGLSCQVPVNQWILGKRSYGSFTNNPLIKWLKSRKDAKQRSVFK